MPSYVLKPSRSEDFYVLWSDIVEAPLYMGDAADMRRILNRDRRCPEPCCYQTLVLDRMRRADETGSSAMPELGFGNWSDPSLICEQQGLLPRELLADYVRAYIDEGSEAAFAFLQPFDDDEIRDEAPPVPPAVSGGGQ